MGELPSVFGEAVDPTIPLRILQSPRPVKECIPLPSRCPMPSRRRDAAAAPEGWRGANAAGVGLLPELEDIKGSAPAPRAAHS